MSMWRDVVSDSDLKTASMEPKDVMSSSLLQPLTMPTLEHVCARIGVVQNTTTHHGREGRGEFTNNSSYDREHDISERGYPKHLDRVDSVVCLFLVPICTTWSLLRAVTNNRFNPKERVGTLVQKEVPPIVGRDQPGENNRGLIYSWDGDRAIIQYPIEKYDSPHGPGWRGLSFRICRRSA